MLAFTTSAPRSCLAVGSHSVPECPPPPPPGLIPRGVLNLDIKWVWTTKFDTATWPFLKFDMRHGALMTRQEGEIYSDMRHCHFLNSTCDMGTPPSRAPINLGSVHLGFRPASHWFRLILIQPLHFHLSPPGIRPPGLGP